MKRIALAMISLIYVNASAQDSYSVAKESGSFAYSIFKQMATEKGENENIFFSPYSITLAMGMTYAGANNATKHEMATVLHFPADDSNLHKQLGDSQKSILFSGSKGVQISIANQLWADKKYKFSCKYLRGVKKAYGAPVKRLDFRENPDEQRVTINNWVEVQTQNRIKNLLPGGSITNLTAMVLTNAIYFKGQWDEKFLVENTKTASFFPSKKEKMECSMMNRRGKYNLAKGEGFSMIEIPYAGKDFSMLVILPDEDNVLQKFESSLSAEKVASMSARYEEVEVNLSLPRFKFESQFELKPTFTAMGMPLAFSNLADFTRMSSKPDLKIDEVYHKAFVEVSEEGTEAAAATAVVIVRKSMPAYFEFNVNRPFVFLIRHNSSGAFLFMGRVTKPIF